MGRETTNGDARERTDGDVRTEAATGGDDGDTLLTPGEVARLFGVDPKTVTRWAEAGKLRALRTLGGHRRYRSGEVHDLLTTVESG